MEDRFKFRAWNKKNNCWRSMYGKDVDYQIHDMERLAILQSDDFIICQCTGLKDKNGKLIYEGDIVRDELRFTGIVFWNKRQWMVGKPIYSKCCHQICDKYWTPTSNSSLKDFYESEVIGNIYETPELLEEK